MTAKELWQIPFLRNEILVDSMRLEELEADAHAAPTAKYSIMPKSKDGNGSMQELYAPKIIALKDELARKRKKLRSLEKYIVDIDNTFIRRIFILRFEDHKSWPQISRRIGGQSPNGLRMIATRYMEKH